MNSDIETLNQRLRDFGLDPIDWALKVRSRTGNLLKIEILSTGESVPFFEGIADRDTWLALSVQG